MINPEDSQQFFCINKEDNEESDFAYVSNQEGTYYLVTKNKNPELYKFFANIFCYQFTEKEFKEKVKDHYKEVFKFEDLQPSESIWTDEEWNEFLKYKNLMKNKIK